MYWCVILVCGLCFKSIHAMPETEQCTCASPAMQVDAGAVLLARNSRFADDEVHIFARMSGMLDLSRDEKATCPPELQRRRKHFLPRWLRDAPRTLGRPTGLPSANLPSETQGVSAAHSVYEGCFVDDEEAVVELDGLLDR